MSLYIGGGPTNLAGDVSGPSNANTVLQLTGSAGVVNSPAAISFNGRTTPSSGGDIRGPKDFLIGVRNSTNASNLTLIDINGADVVRVGDTSAACAGAVIRGGSTTCYVNVTPTFTQVSGAGGSLILSGSTTNLQDNTATTALALSLNATGASTMQWVATTTPSISHAQATGAAAADFTISAQDAKAASGANGGNLVLTAGRNDGAGVQGAVKLTSNGTTYLTVGNSGLFCGFQSVAIAAGNNTLTAGQYANPVIRLTGNLVGSAATVILPNQPGMWFFDYSAVTGALGLNFKSGTTTSATLTTPSTTTQQVVQVCTFGGNTVAINL